MSFQRPVWLTLIIIFALGNLLALTTVLAAPQASFPIQTVSDSIEAERIQMSDASARFYANQHNAPTIMEAEPEEPSALGEACGAGELMPDWVICLHGQISMRDQLGALVPLSGVPISIAYGDLVVTGTTRIRPGDVEPTYGIDISPLEPAYLQPVTLTAWLEGTPIQRQVIVAPNFNTQSQRYDLIINEVGALDPSLIWGHVVDFAANGPVTGALVTAEYQNNIITATTSVQQAEEAPIYTFDSGQLALLDAGAGSVLTLTAVFSDDVDQQVIVVPTESTQIDFVTGWKCDDTDPLPRSSSGDGLPRSSSGDGLPNVACFWGYTLVDGIPTAGVDVYYEISGTTYAAVSKNFAREGLPRYAIGVFGVQDSENQNTVIASAMYSGTATSQIITITLDARQSQQNNLLLFSTNQITSYLHTDYTVSELVWEGDYLWSNTLASGVLRWDIKDGSYMQLTEDDGLIDNQVRAIALAENGVFWFGTLYGVSRYSPGAISEWQSFTIANGLASNSISDIVIAPDEAVWFATDNGVTKYSPAEDTWITYDMSDGLLSNRVYVIEIAPDGSYWFGTSAGASYFAPSLTDPVWESVILPNVGPVASIEFTDDGMVWLGTYERSIAKCDKSTGTMQCTEQAVAIPSVILGPDDTIFAVEATSQDTLWVSTWEGAAHISSADGSTISYLNKSNGLINNDVRSISVGGAIPITNPILTPPYTETIWVGTANGLSRYNPSASYSWLFPQPEWLTLMPVLGPNSNNVRDILPIKEHGVLFGTSAGINLYNPSLNSKWISLVPNDGIVKDSVLSIASDESNGIIWFGTENGTLRYSPNLSSTWSRFTTTHGLIDNVVNSVAVAPDGSVWFGTQNGVSQYKEITDSVPIWNTFTATHGLANNVVNSVAVAPDGSVWFGTQNGASQHKEITDSVSMWNTFTTTHGLADNAVNSVAVAPDGSVWFGTQNGVSQYKEITDSVPIWNTFTATHGLANNVVNSVAVAPDGSVWFGTVGGATRYSPSLTPQWMSLSSLDGLVNNAVQSIQFEEEKYVWFGTASGISIWNQQQLLYPEIDIDLFGPNQILAGSLLTYTISAKNLGTSAVTLTANLSLSSNLEYVSSTITPADNMSLIWQLDNLRPGEFISWQVKAFVNSNIWPDTVLEARAEASSIMPEASLENNIAYVKTRVADPTRVDARITLLGPDVIVANEFVVYSMWLDNIGGKDANNTQLNILNSEQLQFTQGKPEPTTQNPLSWDLGTLAAHSAPQRLVLTMTVAPDIAPESQLSVTASLTTTTRDGNPSNNQATIAVRTSLEDAETLILVAPERLAAKYGASPLLDKLYEFADHPRVSGAVINILNDPAIAQAYAVWDQSPSNQQAANGVAWAIKSLIDTYTITYPNLRYLVFVGGDDLIPFYRVKDRTNSYWQERNYAHQLPPSTVRAALQANQLLTDDFYADRTPTMPPSYFWRESREMYLPDFATGRLVETPTEMMAVLDAFLQSDGVMTLDSALVGTFRPHTHDLGQVQCGALQADGIPAMCTQSGRFLETEATSTPYASLWTALHSNHFSIDRLSVYELQASPVSYEQTLFASLGCHAGLNISPDVVTLGHGEALDLPQVTAGLGGTTIGANAYTFASRLSVGYTEALGEALTQQLLLTNTPTLGEALVQAKQAYYASHAGWFNALDEKVLLPMTLYGLPMLEVQTPPELLSGQTAKQAAPMTDQINMQLVPQDGVAWTTLAVTLPALTYEEIVTDTGRYFTFEGHALAQDGLPLQPNWSQPLSTTIAGQTPRGVWLEEATYDSLPNFDPLLTHAWALGYETTVAEPLPAYSGWDRERPYQLGEFDGLQRSVVNLNLVLAAHQAETEELRLFRSLDLAVHYSSSPDHMSPTINGVEGFRTVTGVSVQAFVTDNVAVGKVSAVCDDGQGKWHVQPLEQTAEHWQGLCPVETERLYLQVADEGGNVTTGEFLPTTELGASLQASATLQGRTNHVVTVTVGLYQSSEPQMAIYETTMSADVAAGITLAPFISGTYTMTLKAEGYLQAVSAVTLTNGSLTYHDFGELAAGDVNGDNLVNILDLSVLAGAYNTREGDTAFNGSADFNGDGLVNILDLSLLAGNYNTAGARP